jgi:hypothetical protein
MAKTKIDRYTLNYSSNTFHPRIWLYNERSLIGQLIFIPNDQTLPNDNMDSGGVNLYYFIDEYLHTIDILRNEDPVYLSYNGPNIENGITTSEEDVGEGE